MRICVNKNVRMCATAVCLAGVSRLHLKTEMAPRSWFPIATLLHLCALLLQPYAEAYLAGA
jgi:hypothetical protein